VLPLSGQISIGNLGLFYLAYRAKMTALPRYSLELAMPFFLVILLLNITLVYHAAKTDRLQPWAFIILIIPVVGALAYIAVEIIPEWLGGHGAQQARRRIANRLNPEKRYHELSDALAATDTIANRVMLAAECLSRAFRGGGTSLRSCVGTADGRRADLRLWQGEGPVRAKSSR
jgi:hypothetical protein